MFKGIRTFGERAWLAFLGRLRWKLFVSYLAVIFVGGVTIWWAGWSVAPSAFERHLAAMARSMEAMMSQSHGMWMEKGWERWREDPLQLERDLFFNFRAAMGEALLRAVLVAGLAALAVSWFVTRQIVAPMQAISRASRRIAQGHYEERVAVPGDLARGVFDELGELAWNFNRMAERLARTEEARRQWLADVSHEMRTPLASIRAYVEGLLDGVLPPEPRVYAQILEEVQRLQRFVDDLREISRMEAGALDLNLVRVFPQVLLEAAYRRFLPAYREKGVHLVVEVEDNLPALQVDRERMLQVVSNLLENALRYTPAGGQVTLRARRVKPERVRFEVQDTGVGIPPEHLPHIFKRFYRVEPSRSRSHGGSGLGLTIARLIVEAHGGRIWAESPGRGSIFIFEIPLQAAASRRQTAGA